MPGAFLSDLAPFFAASEFGTSATWTAVATGTPVAGTVLFDAPGADVLADVTAIDYVVTYRVDQWASVRSGDTITISAVAYKVREVMPIDDGLIAKALVKRVAA
jgi:hypothetical protein